MRHALTVTTLTLLAATLAACGPQGAAGTPGTPGTPVLPGASAAPGQTGGASPAGGAAPTGGVTTDLATRFPVPGAQRHVVYAWTSGSKSGNKQGTDDIRYDKCESSCLAVFSRTLSDGKLERSGARVYPQFSEGVVLPVLDEFEGGGVDLAAALKKGGHPEEEVTVKAGRFKAIKVTIGGSRNWTWWIQKPWVVKAEFSDPAAGASATLALEKLE